MAENNKKTAVLVIHGVGPHTSFQACDSFVQGFCSSLTKSGDGERVFDLQHRLKQRENWLGTGMPWVQNYVSFTVPGTDKTVDFYEYFWDIYMVHEASFNEAFKMLSSASKSAHEFYKRYRRNNPNLLEKGTDLGEFGRRTKFGFGHAEFRPAGYLKLLGPLFAFISIISPYVPFMMNILDRLSKTQIPVLQEPLKALSGWLKEPVPHFIGDLVRYLDLDPRSERFEIRRKIINGALEELRALLKDSSYNRIIIAGHSLGSVIGYDALNRVIQEVSTKVKTAPGSREDDDQMIKDEEAAKIKGFVSFGSPLDKIALFFRQQVKEGKEVQKQVIAHLRGFRVKQLEEDEPGKSFFCKVLSWIKALFRSILRFLGIKKDGGDEPVTKMKFNIDNPIGSNWDDSIKWLNFYHKKDVISGKLDLYNLEGQSLKHQNEMPDDDKNKGDGNIEITDKFGKLVAHGCYWGAYLGRKKGTDQMHRIIIEEFFS